MSTGFFTDLLSFAFAFAQIISVSKVALARMVSKDVDDQLVGAVLEDVNNGVIERVLVLLQPPGQVVGDRSGIMDDRKVSVLIGLGHRLHKVVGLAKMVGLQLVLKGLVSGLWEERLFFKDGQDTHRLLEEIDASLQVHSEVNHGPVDAFLEVLFLLEHEGVVVEELLQLLIAEVDAELLESIVLEPRTKQHV